MRFHLDEHVDPAIAEGLRQRGIEVTTTVEASLLAAEDQQHVDYAAQTGRVIFTNDADFLRLANQSIEHAGIVYCASQTRSVGEVVRHLCLMHDALDEEAMLGRIEYLFNPRPACTACAKYAANLAMKHPVPNVSPAIVGSNGSYACSKGFSSLSHRLELSRCLSSYF